jgi:hypothetical protein
MTTTPTPTAPVAPVHTVAPVTHVVHTAPVHAVHQAVLVVPGFVSNSVHFLERNWIAIVGILVIALLSTIVTEIAKHKWSVKYEEQKAKTIVRWVLLAVSTGFTALGTIIYFMQSNSMSLSKLPFIGQNEVEVLGAAWTLYNFRLNKTFANVRAKLTNWADAKNPTTPVIQPVQPIQTPSSPTPPPTELVL